MKKSLVSLVLSLSLASSLVAEESGAFFGIGIGSGWANAKIRLGAANDDRHGSGLSFEAVAGYKQFFTQNFGLRYYANISQASFKNQNPGTTSVMNYGANIDMLVNFVDSQTSSFGAFLGVGVGANTWSGHVVDELERLELSLKKTLLDTSLNIGLRSVIDSRHSVEGIVRVPLLSNTLYSSNDLAGYGKAEAKAIRSANIGVRYILNF